MDVGAALCPVDRHLSARTHRCDDTSHGRRRDLKADQLAAEFLGEPLEPDLEDFD